MDEETLNQNAGAGPGEGQPSPESAQPPAVETPVAPSDSRDGLLEPDVQRIFEYDPFSKEKKPEVQPKTAEKPGDQAPPATTPAPVAATPQPNAEITALQQELAELRGQLAASRQPQQPQPSNEDQAVQRTRQLLEKYQVSFPQPIMAAFLGEDPNARIQALGAMLAVQAARVEESVMQQVRSEMGQYVPQELATRERDRVERQRINSEFYSENKDLDNPVARMLVVQAARTVMQETGRAQWTPAFKAAVAARAREMIKMLPGQQQAQVRPPVFTQPGTRGGPVGGSRAPSPNSPEAIADSLFG